MSKPDLHEDFTREDEIVGSSDRSFGVTLAVVALLIGAIKLWRDQSSWVWWVTVGAVFLGLALLYPPALAPLNRLWLRLGVFSYRVISPIVIALIFITAVLPTGLVMRALGKDPLRLKRDAAGSTYWISREPSGLRPEIMKRQF